MNKNIGEKRQEPFDSIVGKQLSAVVFVLDYVQLQFAGQILTCLNWPTVTIEDIQFRFGEQEYRNRLCEQIGKPVASAFVVEEQEICLKFPDEAAISVSLKPEDYVVAEAAIFDDESGGMGVVVDSSANSK